MEIFSDLPEIVSMLFAQLLFDGVLRQNHIHGVYVMLKKCCSLRATYDCVCEFNNLVSLNWIEN